MDLPTIPSRGRSRPCMPPPPTTPKPRYVSLSPSPRQRTPAQQVVSGNPELVKQLSFITTTSVSQNDNGHNIQAPPQTPGRSTRSTTRSRPSATFVPNRAQQPGNAVPVIASRPMTLPLNRPQTPTQVIPQRSPSAPTIWSTRSPGPSTFPSGRSPGPSTFASGRSPGPSTFASGRSPGPSTFASTRYPGPSTLVSTRSPGPTACASTRSPGPPTFGSIRSQVPTTFASTRPAGPATLASRGSPLNTFQVPRSAAPAQAVSYVTLKSVQKSRPQAPPIQPTRPTTPVPNQQVNNNGFLWAGNNAFNDNAPGEKNANFPAHAPIGPTFYNNQQQLESTTTIFESLQTKGEEQINITCICQVIQLEPSQPDHPLVVKPRRKICLGDATGVMIGFIKRPQITRFEKGDTIRLKRYTMKDGQFLIHAGTSTFT